MADYKLSHTAEEVDEILSKAKRMVELPAVTEDDAGKFLRVSSSGKWAAEVIPNAEGVSF